jgi:hypothetical protein
MDYAASEDGKRQIASTTVDLSEATERKIQSTNPLHLAEKPPALWRHVEPLAAAEMGADTNESKAIPQVPVVVTSNQCLGKSNQCCESERRECLSVF